MSRNRNRKRTWVKTGTGNKNRTEIITKISSKRYFVNDWKTTKWEKLKKVEKSLEIFAQSWKSKIKVEKEGTSLARNLI